MMELKSVGMTDIPIYISYVYMHIYGQVMEGHHVPVTTNQIVTDSDFTRLFS